MMGLVGAAMDSLRAPVRGLGLPPKLELPSPMEVVMVVVVMARTTTVREAAGAAAGR